MIRIDKAIASMGYGSRKDIKTLLKDKRVRVNGDFVTRPETKISEADKITIDDMEISYSRYTYLMMNKPEGVVSSTESNDVNVIDLIDQKVQGLFPCGRLDKDTTGLLLITNDGPLAHQLLSPKHHVEKEYVLTLKHAVTPQDIALIAKGVTEGEDTFLPAVYTPTGENTGTIILHEGKFHEIKRIFLALDNEVVQLKRIRMKNLVLDESLEPGEYRPLTEEELTELKQLL